MMHFLQITNRTGRPSRHHLSLHVNMSHTHTEKANLAEECPLLAQVRKKAAELLSDTVDVFRV